MSQAQATIQMAPVMFDTIRMGGGMDQITPTLNLKPGVVRNGLNFECDPFGGYTRIAGYERFDGRALPSSKAYSTVYVSSFVNIPAVGNTITGQTSGATAYVAAVGSNYIVTTSVSGTFTIGEVITVGATTIGTSIVSTGGITSCQQAVYTAAVADVQRALITAVPGSGQVRGVFVYDNVVYAFRDNAGGTAVDLYKSTASGWSQVPFFYEVSFTAGTTAPADGATVTQGGVTATLKRAVKQSGAWTGSAAGRLIVTAPSGGNFGAGAATISGGTTITLSGVQTAIILATGGRFATDTHNFFGGATTTRIYGADGANRMFEFDGTTLVPIATGSSPDTPKHVRVHRNHLFYSVGASLLFSAPGDPYNHTAGAGAGEIGTGGTITNIITLPGNETTPALGITDRDKTSVLYGTALANFSLVALPAGTGGADYTAQNMAQTYLVDDSGVVSLQATAQYGNFDQSTLTYGVRDFIKSKRTRVIGAMLNKEKSQYRVFYHDGFGLFLAIVNGKFIGCLPVYFPNAATCTASGKLSTGEEVSYFGASNGMVYRMDSGTSFDGASIDAYITLAYNSTKSPRVHKRYRKAAVDISADSYVQFQFGYSLGYGNIEIAQPLAAAYENTATPVYWDNFTWDNFTWDGGQASPLECSMEGTSENMAITIRSGTAYCAPYTVNSAIIHYSPRRAMR